MDFVTPLLEATTCLWQCLAPQIAHVGGLENNLNSLRCAAEELRDLNEDIKKRIELAEQQQVVRPRKQVEGWLQRAQVVEQRASAILQRGEREVHSKCLWGWCPRNYCSRFKVGGKVERLLLQVKEERSKGLFEVVADELPHLVVEERPLENTVGLDLMFLDAWRCLNDEKVGILGLYGLGGVGKTTLLTKINNEFVSQRHDFKVVIWVAVVKQTKVEDVQEVIYNRVNLKDLNWHRKGQDEKAVMIYKFLKGMKFVLLLDDIRVRLDLSQVGIPLPNSTTNKGSKIVFTTRFQEVCGQMEADKRIKVPCLALSEARTLFNVKVGEETLYSHPDIRQLAPSIAQECGGLPLALITIGRAMSGKKDPREWRRAIQILRDSPSKFSGMRDYVFSVLRFSYDSLNETSKQCFLYFSLFPEDYDIPKENLVEHWIGESLIKECGDINEARNQGFDIIEVLKSACLLETNKSGKCVKMHDVIRDMALWIACGEGSEWKNKMVVEQHADKIDATRVAKWSEAERIAVFGTSTIDGLPNCPDLLTLLIRDGSFARFPSLFFQHMPSIRVLDLSNNKRLSEFPVEITMLVTLQYLNLSNTNIEKVPAEFRNLAQMRHLLLDFTKDLVLIPREVIVRFAHLRVLSMNYAYSDDCLDETVEQNVLSGGREPLLQELDQLQNLQHLCVTLTTLNSVTKLLTSEKLRRSIRQLCLKRCIGMTDVSFSYTEQMANLERFEVRNCRTLNIISFQGSAPRNAFGFQCLHTVTITDCQILEMNWLVHVPALESLHLQGCKLLQVVLSDSSTLSDYEKDQKVFSKLTTITLFDLPQLRALCPRTLPFPCLEKMSVTLCHSLRKLPFNSNSARNRLEEIIGWPSWWDLLEWEDETIEPIFRAHLKQSS